MNDPIEFELERAKRLRPPATLDARMADLFRPRCKLLTRRSVAVALVCPAALVLLAWFIFPSQHQDSDSQGTEQSSVAIVFMAENPALHEFLSQNTKPEMVKPSNTFVYVIERETGGTNERDAS
jgi:hypothetical protein